MTRAWDVDSRALRLAESRLNLTREIQVKPTYQQKSAGRYKGIEGGKHQITLSSQMTAIEAGRALWHEAQHAAQREKFRTNRQFFQAVQADEEKFEDEAESIERLNRRIPLCRPR